MPPPASVVVGGCGALGRSLVARLLSRGVPTISVDLRAHPSADHSVTLHEKGDGWHDAGSRVREELEDLVQRRLHGVSSVFHVAGGWRGGAVGDKGFLLSVAELVSLNLQSAALAAHIGGVLLPRCSDASGGKGLVVLTGAAAALSPTSCMAAYGLTKAATHHLTQSLADDPALKPCATALAILPAVIDTPANRAAMPDANFHDWTKPEEIASRLVEWLEQPQSRPATGSLVKVITEAGSTKWCT